MELIIPATNLPLANGGWQRYSNCLNSSDIETVIGNCAWCGQGSNYHFHGALDELRVYNRSLTEEEIQILSE
jgi:hypothetical protein